MENKENAKAKNKQNMTTCTPITAKARGASETKSNIIRGRGVVRLNTYLCYVGSPLERMRSTQEHISPGDGEKAANIRFHDREDVSDAGVILP